MTRLILVRHGESEANEKGIYTGHLDFDLSDAGREQAQMAASYLVTHELIDHVYSSDLLRAYNTAKATADLLELSIHTDPRLREADLGDWAGTPLKGKEDSDPEAFRALKEDPSHMQYPGGEYIPDFYDRVIECISEIVEMHPNRTIMIAAHGGTIRALAAYASGYSREEMGLFKDPISNASIHIFEWNEGKAEIRVFNFTDHLNK